jgi:hypothetical protein
MSAAATVVHLAALSTAILYLPVSSRSSKLTSFRKYLETRVLRTRWVREFFSPHPHNKRKRKCISQSSHRNLTNLGSDLGLGTGHRHQHQRPPLPWCRYATSQPSQLQFFSVAISGRSRQSSHFTSHFETKVAPQCRWVLEFHSRSSA